MTSSMKGRSKQVRSQRFDNHSFLFKEIAKKRVLTASLISAFAMFGASAFTAEVSAQQTSRAQTVSSPWTGQNGREIIDLNVVAEKSKPESPKKVKASSVKKANPIRQIQAEIPQESLFDEELESVPSSPVYDTQPLEDPSVLPEPMTQAETATPSLSDSPSVPARTLEATNAPSVYPQGNATKGTSSAKKNASQASSYSTNPYSRIGQAEYNPSQFYGSGNSNASVNGYRNTPPAVAYGQNAYGYGTQCEQGYCDGLFAGFFQNTQLSAGFDGMRSPLDFENAGNYGADLAINWGSVRPIFGGLHAQAGGRGVFTDLNGVEANGFSEENNRTQAFWTAGVYFRANQFSTDGLSFGVVYDSLTENYYRDYDLQQLRTELSYTFGGQLTLGFRGAFGLNDGWCDLVRMDDDLTVEAKVSSVDYYTGFMRWAFAQGGEATVYGGVTEWSEGLVGGSVEAPLTDCFALKCSGVYVFPNERGLNDREEESWSMSMGLVWYLDGGARNGATSPRPLFDVADNGSFLQDFRR